MHKVLLNKMFGQIIKMVFKLSVVIVSLFFIIGCTKGDDVGLLKQKCLSCHNIIPVCVKLGLRNYEQWKDSIIAMKKAGANVSDLEMERLAMYLSKQKPDTVDLCK